MNKILSTLGLCMRSGNLSSGDFAVSEAVRKKNACLVIVAMDASENTKEISKSVQPLSGASLFLVRQGTARPCRRQGFQSIHCGNGSGIF